MRNINPIPYIKQFFSAAYAAITSLGNRLVEILIGSTERRTDGIDHSVKKGPPFTEREAEIGDKGSADNSNIGKDVQAKEVEFVAEPEFSREGKKPIDLMSLSMEAIGKIAEEGKNPKHYYVMSLDENMEGWQWKKAGEIVEKFGGLVEGIEATVLLTSQPDSSRDSFVQNACRQCPNLKVLDIPGLPLTKSCFKGIKLPKLQVFCSTCGDCNQESGEFSLPDDLRSVREFALNDLFKDTQITFPDLPKLKKLEFGYVRGFPAGMQLPARVRSDDCLVQIGSVTMPGNSTTTLPDSFSEVRHMDVKFAPQLRLCRSMDNLETLKLDATSARGIFKDKEVKVTSLLNLKSLDIDTMERGTFVALGGGKLPKLEDLKIGSLSTNLSVSRYPSLARLSIGIISDRCSLIMYDPELTEGKPSNLESIQLGEGKHLTRRIVFPESRKQMPKLERFAFAETFWMPSPKDYENPFVFPSWLEPLSKHHLERIRGIIEWR